MRQTVPGATFANLCFWPLGGRGVFVADDLSLNDQPRKIEEWPAPWW